MKLVQKHGLFYTGEKDTVRVLALSERNYLFFGTFLSFFSFALPVVTILIVRTAARRGGGLTASPPREARRDGGKRILED